MLKRKPSPECAQRLYDLVEMRFGFERAFANDPSHGFEIGVVPMRFVNIGAVFHASFQFGVQIPNGQLLRTGGDSGDPLGQHVDQIVDDSLRKVTKMVDHVRVVVAGAKDQMLHLRWIKNDVVVDR